MAKPDTTTPAAKPTNRSETLTPKPGVEAPKEVADKRLPRQMTDAEWREVVAKVRSLLPSEADALESDREYNTARPVVAREEKTQVDAEVKRLQAILDQYRARVRDIPQRVAYWFDLHRSERHFAKPGEAQLPSPEHIGQKMVDYLNLDVEPVQR